MKNDLRYAFRLLRNHPWFALAVVATLALGIGINTTVFTLVNAVLFKPVPIPGGERLVTVSNRHLTRANNFSGIAVLDYREYKANQRTFESLEAVAGGRGVIAEQGNAPERYNSGQVTAGLFPMLKTAPVLGRGFTPENEKP